MSFHHSEAGSAELELRTDIYYEYSSEFEAVFIYQVFENSPLVTDYVLVGYEYTSSEAHADEVVEQFRMANTEPILPEIGMSN